VAPGFFGWCVPAERGVVRVGVGVTAPHTPAPYLEALLDEHFPQAHVLRRSAGRIPLARPRQSAADGLLLVGDAAGHVKPLSGGGLYTGGRCAEIAGHLAARAARDSGLRQRLAEVYPARCVEAIGRELAFGDSVRHHLSRLRDPDVEMLVDEVDDPALLEFLADRADIDHFHRLPDQLASDPRLWASMLRLVPLISLAWI
jgi:flavin-dependent dehydrogenase